jgi:uncharacterized membrane protein
MTDVPVQLIVAAFNDEKTANGALKELKAAQREKVIRIEDAAVLRKDEKGKLHIKETGDLGGGKGAAFGGVAGAAIGLIAGPALVVPVAVGALVGGLVAKWRDTGFSDERLKKLGEGLKPGSSAIIAVVEHRWVEEVEKAMAEVGADLFTEALQADIADQLESEHDVAYTAISSEAGFAAGRIATGDDDVEGAFIVEDEEGLTASRFVATKEGFAVLAASVDGEGTAVVAAEGTFEEEEENEEKEA